LRKTSGVREGNKANKNFYITIRCSYIKTGTPVFAYRGLRATWLELGKQKQIQTGRHDVSMTLFDALNAIMGEVLHQTFSSYK